MRIRSTVPILVAMVVAILQGATRSRAAEPSPGTDPPAHEKAATATPSFEQHIAPMLTKYCVECHGTKKPKAGLNLSASGGTSDLANNPKVWRQVVEVVEAGEMPPEGRPKPSSDEVRLLTEWASTRVVATDCTKESDPGRVTLRRLNRSEYNNTIRDLFGMDFRPADDFPSDDVGYGFDNIGDVLTLPPLLFERYLAAAESVALQAIVAGPDEPAVTKTWQVEELDESAGGSQFEETGRILGSFGAISVTHPCSRNGEYTLRARAFAQQAGPEPAKMAFQVDGKTVGVVNVEAEQEAPKVYEMKATVAAGSRRISVVFLNDFWDPKAPDPNRRDRNLVIDYLEVQNPSGSKDAPLPDSHTRIIFRRPTKESRHECAEEILERFVSRAYRRPATGGEVARLIKFVDLAEQSGESFETGIQLAVEAVLVSPQFLFRVELDPRRDSSSKKPKGISYPIDEFMLASRLSYFLWSSMPDEELYQLALGGKLRQAGTLEGQVRRMLRDPKAKAFVENFADQWLQIRNLKTLNPDRERFPTFDEPLRAAMQKETELFFESVMRDDRSILSFLDADYTYLNERLAKHYGVAGVSGGEFRRVALRGEDHRGGLLTQASVLAVTSNPTRTSPVKRGKWILEQILGSPPPPPPPDVPELKDEPGTKLTGTLRQRMEQHRANPNCAACHARMDPLGFAFENYDAVGAWREKEEAFPIDASGTLPSGQSFRGASELKTVLKSKDKEFVRCLSAKMLTFAIGRGTEDEDKCAIDRIVDGVARDEYRFSRLVLEIVTSDPFQRRKHRGG